MSAIDPGTVLRMPALPLRHVRVGRPLGCEQAPPPVTTVPLIDEYALGFEEGRAAGWAEGLRLGQEEGRAQGAEQALEQAREEAQTRLQEALEPLQATQAQLQALQASLAAHLTTIHAAAEDQLAALCFELLCRVFGSRAISAEGVRAQVLHLLQQLPDQRQVIVRVHPQDLGALQTAGQLAEGLTWKADEAVPLGGCLLDAPAGTLDARLERILEACKDAILRARQAREVSE